MDELFQKPLSVQAETLKKVWFKKKNNKKLTYAGTEMLAPIEKNTTHCIVIALYRTLLAPKFECV